MSPEESARLVIDRKLIESGWIIQDLKQINLLAGLGIAVREFPTSLGEADYALFINGIPVDVVEAKQTEVGETITTVEGQSARYADSKFKWIKGDYSIRFVYEATDKLTRFTDYRDLKYCSRTVFSFHRPETLRALLMAPDTLRNNLKRLPPLIHRAFVTAKSGPSQNQTIPLPKTGQKYWFRWLPVPVKPLQQLPPLTVF